MLFHTRTILLLLLVSLGTIESAKAQVDETVSIDSPLSKINLGIPTQKIRAKAFIMPVTLLTYGFVALDNKGLHTLNVSTSKELAEEHEGFHVRIDDYLQYSPALAVYGLNAAGIKGKHCAVDRTMIFAISTIISTTTVSAMKHCIHSMRPDLSANNTFPSGHTTTAFGAAEFLNQEFKDRSPWFGVAGYLVATTTGILRMYNQKHYLSDVIAGAGLGILSTKLAYMIYPAVKRKLFCPKKRANTGAF